LAILPGDHDASDHTVKIRPYISSLRSRISTRNCQPSILGTAGNQGPLKAVRGDADLSSVPRSDYQVGGSNLPATNTGSECTQSKSLTPVGRMTMNRAAPVMRPPTCPQ
jgi:hypothetical protein